MEGSDKGGTGAAVSEMCAKYHHWKQWLAACLLPVALWNAPADAATDYEKHADGFAVYLGVLPAEVLRGPSEAHLATMHGGVRSARDSHHLVIAIYDEATRTQVTDAKVAARVAALGTSETRRTLDVMKIADTTTYGNYFPMSGPGPYTIEITIRRESGQAPTRVQFNYTHPR